MKKKFRIIVPHKSLRALLTMWFLLFSVVPIAFVTGYSLVKFEGAFNYEIKQRLSGNFREFENVISELEKYLETYGKLHASDPDFIYDLSMNQTPKVRRYVEQWMRNYSATQVSVFDRDAKLVVSIGKNSQGGIESLTKLEQGDIYLSESLLKEFEKNNQFKYRDLREKRGLELVEYTKVTSANGRLAGYLEEIFVLDSNYLENLKKRLSLDIVLLDAEYQPVVTTQKDLMFITKGLIQNSIEKAGGEFFEMTHQGNSYGLLVQGLTNSDKIFLGLATSRGEIKSVLSGINKAVFSVVALVIVLIIIVLFSVSNVIVKPIINLVKAAKKVEEGELAQLPIETETEVGLLTMSFNNMAKKVTQAQKDLKYKIEELEKANKEIQETQAQLVHSAKMVSLGQLVAGVAHELNNPIGFIYSNMNHLREYSEKLVKIVETAEKDPKNLHQIKKETDFEYIVNDLPKLIKSCEDGARRVRDIVLDLRNFSRADELEKKEYNIEEGLDTTLHLLSGEYKNRIQIHKNYSGVPKLNCYPNQLNQAFMNILSNSIQAIPDKGDIWISTRYENNEIVLSIKDNGKGISEKNKDKIFDPFFTTKSVGKGTGLGLSITYGIIQRHEGTITVNSFEGKGAEFIIRLPL